MGILFKYTAPGTPQQNSIVERAFPAMFGKVRAMMNAAGFDKNKRDKYWTEAALTLTLLENVIVKKGETETPHKKFHGSDPRYTNNLHCFGEIGVIKSIKKHKDKIDDRGHKAIFLGHGEKHAGDVFVF